MTVDIAPSSRVVILTRDPVPGRVKTRLHPALGPEGAARLHEAMVHHTVQTALLSGLPVRLALEGDLSGPFARSLAAMGVEVHAQGEGDLGQRLSRACREPGRVICIGTDCPGLLPQDLRDAAARTGVCFGPAVDGGYWLVALEGADEPLLAMLFEDIPWSTDRTLAVTVDRLEACGQRPSLLQTRADLDTPDDLARWCDDPSCPAALLPLLLPSSS